MSTPPRIVRAALTTALLGVLLAVGLAACGGSDGEPERTACAERPGLKEGLTILVAELEGVGEALALADCTPLYINDVDTEKRVRCTARCARTWVPVTVRKGDSVTTQTPIPIAPVTIVERSDGRAQAALNGKPLYTYSHEGESGASGNGVTDAFGGTEFNWSVITPDEAASDQGQGLVQPGQGQAPVQPGQAKGQQP